MTIGRGERGEGRAGTLLGLAVLAITIYAGVKVVPVLIDGYAFRDYLEEEARFGALRSSNEDIRNRVLRKAQELELPVQGKNIVVNRTNTYLDIKVKYNVPIVTPVYTHNMTFDEAARAPLF
ncbi:MAG: hypothetical protein ACRD5D_06590 [Candidatus Polarisedimenticolia bacterium]